MRLHELPHGLSLAGKSRPTARRITNEQKEVLRCLELDADESAFFASCAVQMRNMENIEGIRELYPTVALRLTIFGCYAMVWLFDAFQDYAKSALGETHPTPSLRLQNIFQTAQVRLFAEADDFEQVHQDALSEFDPVKAAIPTMFTFGTLSDMAHSDELADQLRLLETQRAKVASQLRPSRFYATPSLRRLLQAKNMLAAMLGIELQAERSQNRCLRRVGWKIVLNSPSSSSQALGIYGKAEISRPAKRSSGWLLRTLWY